MKTILATAALAALAVGVASARAQPPAAVTVPPGFTVTVVHEGVGPARHIAVRPNGDLYISTRARAAEPGSGGIIALRDTDGDHRADQMQKFATVEGTGVEFHNGALYASNATTVYRFDFTGGELVPSTPPVTLVSGMPATGYASRGLAFDDHGGLFINIGSGGNLCTESAEPQARGKTPCPDLQTRGGIWRFDAMRAGQSHPADGLRMATGVRDMAALEWDGRTRALYAATQGRNSMGRVWPALYSAEDNAGIADELFRVDAGANLGWPYTYYDGRIARRLVSPEYGGDGKTAAGAGFTEPLAALQAHSSPLDLTFGGATSFPAAWRNGVFIALHGGSDGPSNQNGYQVVFLPISAAGKAGTPRVFADGFAGAPEQHSPAAALHRPSSVAVGPDGALYVLDSKKGRVWRIAYGR